MLLKVSKFLRTTGAATSLSITMVFPCPSTSPILLLRVRNALRPHYRGIPSRYFQNSIETCEFTLSATILSSSGIDRPLLSLPFPSGCNTINRHRWYMVTWLCKSTDPSGLNRPGAHTWPAMGIWNVSSFSALIQESRPCRPRHQPVFLNKMPNCL